MKKEVVGGKGLRRAGWGGPVDGGVEYDGSVIVSGDPEGSLTL